MVHILRLVEDESRLKLLANLRSGKTCVSELINRTGFEQSLISHHLRDLFDGGLVEKVKEGRFVYYFLSDKGQRIVNEGLADAVWKLVGEETRIKILEELVRGSLCVSELITRTGFEQSLISHHLRDLKDEGLVDSQKDGRWVNYSLAVNGRQVMKFLEDL